MPLGDDLQDSTISKSMYTIPVSWALIRRALYTYKPTYKRQGVQKHAKKCNVGVWNANRESAWDDGAARGCVRATGPADEGTADKPGVYGGHGAVLP